MGYIGYFIKGGGIEEIFFESGICKRRTVNKAITAKYWLIYVEMVSILKRYIKAERSGD